MSSPSSPHTPAGTVYEMPLSANSPQSHLSVRSGSTITENKPASQTMSGFSVVDSIANSRRKRARRPDSNSSQSMRRSSIFGVTSASGSTKAHTRTAPIEFSDEEAIAYRKSPRKFMPQDVQRGSVVYSSDEREYTTRKHNARPLNFPNMRINESTVEQTAKSRYTTTGPTQLHKQNRPASHKTADLEDSDSEDELAMTNASNSVFEQAKLHSKARRAAHSGVRREGKTKAHSKTDIRSYPLVFARAHGYEIHGSEMENGHHDLVLRISSESWRIVAFAHTTDSFETKVEFRPRDVIKVQADSVSRIRLEGPRKQNGSCPIFDFEFVDTSDHEQVRDVCVNALLMNGKVILRKE